MISLEATQIKITILRFRYVPTAIVDTKWGSLTKYVAMRYRDTSILKLSKCLHMHYKICPSVCPHAAAITCLGIKKLCYLVRY